MGRPLAVLTLLLALLCALPARAHAAANMELALQDDAVFVTQHGMTRDQALDRAQALHATRIRVNVLWARVLTSDPTARSAPAAGPAYDFSGIDALQAAAAQRGIKLQLTLTGPAPAWATADHHVDNDAPSPAAYASFVHAVVAHFAGRVDRYSIWNEPNWSSWLAPAKRAPALYRALYTAGYAAVKRADPHAQVLFGELAPSAEARAIAPLTFLRAVTQHGRLKADGFALHPYQFTRAPQLAAGHRDDVTIGTLGRLTSALTALARTHKLATPAGRPLDLYLTEFGYLSAGSRAEPAPVRAAWLRRAYAIARANPRVRELLQYQLLDPPAAEAWHSALLTRAGLPTPAFASLAHAAAGH